MSAGQRVSLAVRLLAMVAIIAGGATALASEPKKSTKHKGEAVIATAPVEPAPLQLNVDTSKVLPKPDPVLPYQPTAQSKVVPTDKKADNPGQPHLAPLLRESSLPESQGDRGSFFERHEFGIQLRDHF